MSLTREALSPATTSGGSYPVLHGKKPKNQRESLFREAMGELLHSWDRYDAGWYGAGINKIPERIKLGDVIDDQLRRLLEMVKEVSNEFGALIIKDGNNVELAFFQVGKAHEIDLAPTRPLKDTENLIGVTHGHPSRDYPSTTDIYTFLKQWEIASIIIGSEGTIYLTIKTEKTIVPKISLDEFDKTYESGQNIRFMAKDYDFLLYIGHINSNVLKLEGGESDIKEAGWEKLLSNIKGVKTVVGTVKKVKMDSK